MKSARLPTFLALGVALALGGCAVAPTAPTVMVLPGTKKEPAQFQADSLACQLEAQALLATATEVANNQAASNVFIGTLLGAAVGALLGQGSYNPGAVTAWGAGTGLLFGSAAAGGNSQVASYSLQQRFDFAYMQCMYQRGNQVPGQATYGRQLPVAPAPPPPGYGYPAQNTAPPYPPQGYPAPNLAPSTYPPQGYPAPNPAAPGFPVPGNTSPNFPPPNTPPPS